MTQQLAKQNIDFDVDHNVYIIGAGFSTKANLPVMGNFLEEMQKVRQSGGVNSKLASSIDSLLKFRKRSASAAERMNVDLDNIETLLSLAVLTDNEAIEKDAAMAISGTLSLLQAKFYKNNNTIESNFYDSALRLMLGGGDAVDAERKNTFITLNYDTILEQSFTNIGVNFGYGIRVGKPGQLDISAVQPTVAEKGKLPLVLKIHGSVNWNTRENEDEEVDNTESSDAPKQRTVYSSFDDLINSNGAPYILPPTWRKQPDWLFGKVWSKAIERLQTATRIIFIGYSFPLSDQHVKYLLTAGLQQNISLSKVVVVDRNPEVYNRVSGVFSHSYKKIVHPDCGVPIHEFFHIGANVGLWLNSLEEINRSSN